MRSKFLITIALVLTIAISGCTGATEPPVDPGGFLRPMMFVNDRLYLLFDHRPDFVPEPDDSWAFLGEVQSISQSRPAENFHTNVAPVGSRVYHSDVGRIRFNFGWDFIDPDVYTEFYGDSLVVIDGENRSLYISEEMHDKVNEMLAELGTVPILRIDGVLHELRASESGGDFRLGADYVFLGEVRSRVAPIEHPTEDFQANDAIVGARVYRLPEEHREDLLVFFGEMRLFFAEKIDAPTGEPAPETATLNFQITRVESVHDFLEGVDTFYPLDFLAAYSEYWGIEDDHFSWHDEFREGWRDSGVIVSANVPLRDFQVIFINYDDEFERPFVSRSFNVTDILMPEMYIVLSPFFTVGGVLPREGISFVDPDGIRRNFAIIENRRDPYPPYFLREFDDEGILPIATDLSPLDIPAHSPRLYVSLSTEGLPTQHFRAAQGTTSWSPAFAFADMFQIGDVITSGGYQASGDHPLDFWRETWECIDFTEFVASFEGTDSKIELRFSNDFMPNTIYARRWSTEYIGMSSEMWNVYEPIEVTGNIIHISDDGNDYIYEVEARWARGDNPFGRAFYTFRLNSSK